MPTEIYNSDHNEVDIIQHSELDDIQESTEKSDKRNNLICLPTVISLAGLAMVAHGSQNIETIVGLNTVMAGRACDLIDGALARKLGIESDTGAVVDAVCDKLGVGLILASEFNKGIVPAPILAGVMASTVLNASFSLAAQYNNPETKYTTPKSGKYAMALYNAAIISYPYAVAMEVNNPENKLSKALMAFSVGAFAVGTICAVPTAIKYAKRVRKTEQQ